MKPITTISKLYRSTISIFAILMLLWTAHAPFNGFPNQVSNSPVAEEQDKSDQSQSNEEEFTVVAYVAVLPLLHANFSSVIYFSFKLEEILMVFEKEEKEFIVPFISYFNTLFRIIISPNAP